MRINSKNTAKAVRATRCLINQQRRAAGLRSLKGSKTANRAAGRFARDMVRRRYFDHTSPGGSDMVDRLRSSGYLTHRVRTFTVGENIQSGTGRLATPRQAVRQWMASSGHRANILSSSFRDIGIGVTRGDAARHARAATFVADFGKRSF